MAPEEPAVELYDFLYRDPVRIPSYYAQLFGGKLSSVELTTTARAFSERSGKASILGALMGEAKGGDDRSTGRKEVLDASDMLATDVLSALVSQKRLRTDVLGAPFNSLLMTKGDVTFVDQGTLKLGKLAIDSELKTLSKDRAVPNRAEKQHTLEMIGKLIDTIVLPSLFFMQIAPEQVVVGQVAEEGMSAPISSHYFKHGDSSLREVYVVGIKETDGPKIVLPNSAFFTAAMGMAKVLGDMMVPKGVVRVTPIALFRKPG